MSRTYRKDEGHCFIEGNPLKNKNVNHHCRCEYCTGIRKKEIREKIINKETKKQIKEYYRGDLAG